MRKPKRKYFDLSPEERGQFDLLLGLRDEMKREQTRLQTVVRSHRRYSESDRAQAREALNAFYNDAKKLESAMHFLTSGRKL